MRHSYDGPEIDFPRAMTFFGRSNGSPDRSDQRPAASRVSYDPYATYADRVRKFDISTGCTVATRVFKKKKTFRGIVVRSINALLDEKNIGHGRSRENPSTMWKERFRKRAIKSLITVLDSFDRSLYSAPFSLSTL